MVAATAFSHCASSVTFSSTKPVLPPVFARRPAVSLPRSARMSPIITEAPAFVSASAIAAPIPRAPPVTKALRPTRLFSLIVCSFLCYFIWCAVGARLCSFGNFAASRYWIFRRLPSCLVGMEACTTAHHWARELIKLGHTVRLIPPSYVKRSKKNIFAAHCPNVHFCVRDVAPFGPQLRRARDRVSSAHASNGCTFWASG